MSDGVAAKRTSPPSEKLALLSALIARDYDSSWISRPVSQLASPDAPRPEKLSRLRARLQPKFEALVEESMRPGRPPRKEDPADENRLLRQLLALVPREVWRELRGERRLELVRAQERLSDEAGITQAQFCEMLGLPGRTLRSWKEKEKRPDPPPQRRADPERENKKKRRRGGESTGRFDLEVTMPGQQLMADTSAWTLFATPLRIVGVQDPGWRKKRLWESFAIHHTEDSELVVKTVAAALRPGMQLVCDQGKPYVSGRTIEAIDALDCEHAPQKEGSPTEKSPKERAFRTVKDALEPIRKLTDDLACAIPALRDARFARAAGRILLAAFLRVYETAPRDGGHPLAAREREELDAIAEEQRERARAETRSVRLTLEQIHRAYRFPGSAEAFIRAHRNHALEDIQEAERRLRPRLADPQISASDRYFAGILRNVRDENLPRRRRERERQLAESKQRRELEESRREERRREALLCEQPDVVLAEGLELVSAHWIAAEERLYSGGRGLGTCRLHQALRSMASENAYTLRDRAEAVWRAWAARRPAAKRAELDAIRSVFERVRANYERDPASVPLAELLA